MGGFDKYLILDFFSFNAVASVDYIYLRVGRVRPGGGGGDGRLQGLFIYFLPGGYEGVKNKFEQKEGGSRQIIIFKTPGLLFFQTGG